MNNTLIEWLYIVGLVAPPASVLLSVLALLIPSPRVRTHRVHAPHVVVHT